jgi:predicted RNase H-like HicB family nuclease
MTKITKQILSFTVIYEEDPDGGYVVSVPTLPGCHTQGETIKEAEKNIKEAIELFLESLESNNEDIPKETRVLQGRVDVQFPVS